jgi:hypothetical protein
VKTETWLLPLDKSEVVAQRRLVNFVAEPNRNQSHTRDVGRSVRGAGDAKNEKTQATLTNFGRTEDK